MQYKLAITSKTLQEKEKKTKKKKKEKSKSH